MVLHTGQRVFWGAPEVIYLEGTITQLDPDTQTAIMQVERATPHSAHLIGSQVPFAADGVTPLQGESPPGTTSNHNAEPLPAPILDDAEKVRRTAAVAVHQQYGYTLPKEQEQDLIEQVTLTLNNDPALRAHIIASMDAILKHEFHTQPTHQQNTPQP